MEYTLVIFQQMRHLILLLTIMAIALVAKAQKVITVSTRKVAPVRKAQVYINGKRDLSFLNGKFSIGNAQAGTVKVVNVGYEEWQGRMEELVNGDTIKLDTLSRYLREVKIEGTKLKSDSSGIREEFKKDFAYKPFKFHQAFTLTTINVDILYGSLSIKNRRLKKFKKKLAADERKQYLERVFNPELVGHLTELKGEELVSFISKYMPDYDQVKIMSKYQINSYIIRCYTNDPQFYKSL